MKRIFLFLAVVASGVIFQSCDGDDGAPGPATEVFEVTTSFTANNNYLQTFELTPVIPQSDNILVYELANTNDNIDTWALLPQIYYFDQGQAQYNYTFSYDQFTVLIDGDFNLNLLPASFTSNKTFRIVIVPGNFSKSATTPVDLKDYNAVIKYYNIDDSKVKVLK